LAGKTHPILNFKSSDNPIDHRIRQEPPGGGGVKIAYSDIDGILRGKYISTEKFLSGIDSGTAFC